MQNCVQKYQCEHLELGHENYRSFNTTMLCATRFTPNNIKTTASLYMSDAHKSNCIHNYRNPSSKQKTYKSTNSDIKPHLMFLVYALNFHNTNNEILKSHVEHKPPKHIK